MSPSFSGIVCPLPEIPSRALTELLAGLSAIEEVTSEDGGAGGIPSTGRPGEQVTVESFLGAEGHRLLGVLDLPEV